MTETKRNIEEYSRKLPKLKERVIAAVILLVLSVSMLASASFAWLALSANPELSGVSTSIASNGNLEIALATGSRYTSVAPGATQLGDSNKNNVDRNITWGNLINLSDPAYGLENLVLRPAKLNTSELLTSPLYGALYTSDGRHEQLDSSFGFTTWVPGQDGKEGKFMYTTNLGVNAISSITRDLSGEQEEYYKLYTEAKNKNLAVASAYSAIANNTKQMQSLATMMGLYMTASLNPSEDTLNNPECDPQDLKNLFEMYEDFLEAMDMEADAIAAALNFQMYASGARNFPEYTADMVKAITGVGDEKDYVAQVPYSYTYLDEVTNKTVTVSGTAKLKIEKLGTFLKDYKTVAQDLEKLKELKDKDGVKYNDSGLSGIVNNLTDVGACTIGDDNTPISAIEVENALSYLSGTQEARITNGILYSFEERTGGYIEVKNLSISAKVKRLGMTIPATVKANVQTTAPRNTVLFTNDLNYGVNIFESGGSNNGGGEVIANDTYGLAIDLWVRTNASGGFLTLEGNILLSEVEYVDAKGTDINGNEVQLYIITRTIAVDEGSEETMSVDYTLYQIITQVTNDETGETEEVTTWYNADTHGTFTLNEGETPKKKVDEVRYVIGYEGENRVWEGEPTAGNLSVSSTTQGSGSCYVFYPANSEDQARTIELLKSFKVAFVAEDGTLLAIATMNTEMRYEEPGKVIVPLQLDSSNSTYVGDDASGNPIYAIAALEKNVATRITAIVYLDGTEVENDDVLSAANIQGRLNIQFGTTASLNNAENEELELKEINISATLDKTEFSIDDDDAMTTNIALTVTGDKPNTVTAYFYRELNSTQGARERLITFTDTDGDGVWTASYTFTAPGKYVLRSVFIDGVERELSNAEHPRVNVEGFTIRSLTFSSELRVLTAASSHTAPMTIEFASHDADKMPQAVEARFRRDDGTVAAAVFKYDATSGKWKSDVKFTFSGTYKLTSIYLDGIETPLPEGMDKSITLYLGMYVEVYTDSPRSFKYDPDKMTNNEKNLAMKVKIYDNSGKEMPALTDVQLYYKLNGSSVEAKGMNANVTWNASTQYYEGTFSTITVEGGKIGTFDFSKVTVGANIITNADTSPTFRIMSPQPPEMTQENISNTNSNTANLSTYAFSPDADTFFYADISYSSTATVKALIQEKDGQIHEVAGEISADNNPTTTWKFLIPDGLKVNGAQDGNWTLVGFKIWDYYDKAGNYISSDDEPMVIELATPIQKKIATKATITFPDGQSKDLSGKAFMESYTVSGLNVKITDFEGEAITGISDVKLTFAYNGKSATYGGYTRTDLDNTTPGATIDVSLTSDDGKTFTQKSDATFLFAGEYTTTFSFKVRNTSTTYSGNTLPANAPKFTVSTKVPTVTVTGTYPSGSNPTQINWTTKNMSGTGKSGTIATFEAIESEESSIDSQANKATVYALPTVDNGGTLGDDASNHSGNFTKPTVTLTVGGIGTNDVVSIILPANGKAPEVSFSRTGEGNVTGTLGATGSIKTWTHKRAWVVSFTHTLYAYYGYGEVTIDRMTITRDGVTYTITLKNPVVIYNPSSVNKTS